MVLDISFCRTIKGQKSMSFPGPKIWNKLSSNIKTVATAASFTHHLKIDILSKLQECSLLILLIFHYYLFIYFSIFLTVDCFLPYLYASVPLGRS